MSFVYKNQVFMDFNTWLRDTNVLGLGIGFLIGQTTLDTSKSVVSSLIMPLIQGLRALKSPQFKLGGLVESLITFVITMLVIFFLVKIFKLQTKQPQFVQVVN